LLLGLLLLARISLLGIGSDIGIEFDSGDDRNDFCDIGIGIEGNKEDGAGEGVADDGIIF